VIGASRDPSRWWHCVLAIFARPAYPGRVVPVNVSGDTVQGSKPPSLLGAEESDLAVITVPAAGVLPALKDCVSKGVRGAVVISAASASHR